ncbi:MAG: chloride channel protein [Calditrichaeota bacterium]|nr:chloride channel protein [Calditrichota bacterium]
MDSAHGRAERSRAARIHPLRHTGKWVLLSVLMGVVGGLAAIGFFELLQLTSHLLLGTVCHYHPPAPAGEATPGPPGATLPVRWLLVLMPALGGLLAGAMVFFLAPEAEGHGTDAVIDSFHRHRGRIRSQVPLVKAISSIITIGSGGSAGREGPIAQIAAGFGSVLASLLRLTDAERRTLLTSGMAAGVGAIFRSPLGGALFSVEVLYKRDFEAGALIPSLISSIVAYSVFTYRFGFGHLFSAHVAPFERPVELLFHLGLGVACAALGIVFVRVFYGMRDRFFRQLPVPNYLKPAIGGLMLGGLAWFVPEVLSGGYGFLQMAIDGHLAFRTLAVLACAKILATSFTVSSGGSGGVFAPSMVIGGMLGGAFGQAAKHFFPHLIADPNVFVLVGMGAFFAGVAKTPISSMLMVCEMTGGYQLLVPMMGAASVAYLLTGQTSIYEKQPMRMADSPAHVGDFTFNVLEELSVRDAWRPSAKVIVVREDMRMPEFRRIVAQHEESYFPVVDHHKRIVGIISLRNVHSVLFAEDLDRALVARDLMVPPVVVTLNENLHSALQKFVASGYGQIPVVDESDPTRIVGLLSHEDLIEAYNRELLRRKGQEEALKRRR